MRDIELFQMALGLLPPWFVDRSEFDADGKQLDIYIIPAKSLSQPMREAGRCILLMSEG